MSTTFLPSTSPDQGEVSVLTAKGRRTSHKSSNIRIHDFRKSSQLATSKLQRIRQHHEKIVESLATRLATFLRLDLSMQLSKVQILDYQQFIQNLPSPTHITIFKTEPLKGTGLLVLPPRMGITFVDRLLGGPGQIPAEGRDLTEIEVVLIDEIVLQVVKEWCNHWSEVQGLEPALMGHENNSHFLQTATPETSTLILTICVGIGEQSESIQLMFPYSTVEQLFRSPSPARPSAAAPRPQEIPKNWIPDFSEIKVPVVAEWADLKISSGEITHLKPGDLLMLDPACAAHLKILFNHIPKFTGRPGTTAGNWAVQLTAPVNSY